jgi:hypothetical protein
MSPPHTSGYEAFADPLDAVRASSFPARKTLAAALLAAASAHPAWAFTASRK